MEVRIDDDFVVPKNSVRIDGEGGVFVMTWW